MTLHKNKFHRESICNSYLDFESYNSAYNVKICALCAFEIMTQYQSAKFGEN